jgi:hypothetical protein
MPIYSEQSAGGVQEVIFDTKDNEGCEIQKPQMKKDEDKKIDHRSSGEHSLYSLSTYEQ